MKADFKPGDRVEYCGIEAVVVDNYGSHGTVDIPGEGLCTWLWMFDGEPVRRIS